MTKTEILNEIACCYRSPAYFINTYCHIYDATGSVWRPFRLWPMQQSTLRDIERHRLVVILKARQLGLTWLVLAYTLWMMLFRPAATILIFSKRDDEATYLLGDERLRGMYGRLPDFLQAGLYAVSSNDHEWQLCNGSIARAFPTTAGDSYTATLAIVDEADLVPDLNRLMRAVKPTIDGGGRMILLSRSDKSQPNSEFKNIYRAARLGVNGWYPVFLPWHARPERDEAWYRAQADEIYGRTSSHDDLHEQYPATDTEALAPRSLDKRIPAPWLIACYEEMEPLSAAVLSDYAAPALPQLRVYRLPESGREYVIGIDPAEGNPSSDDSAFTVLDTTTGEEVAMLAGKVQPDTLAAYAEQVGVWFNDAAVLVERNNHGHAVLLWLKDNSVLHVLSGFDDRPGWLSNSRGKSLLYTAAAEDFRDGQTVLHSFATFTQLASIEGATLRAPKGETDDLADSYALAQMARRMVYAQVAESETIRPVDPLAELEF